jgi:hypothetical protein
MLLRVSKDCDAAVADISHSIPLPGCLPAPPLLCCGCVRCTHAPYDARTHPADRLSARPPPRSLARSRCFTSGSYPSLLQADDFVRKGKIEQSKATERESHRDTYTHDASIRYLLPASPAPLGAGLFLGAAENDNPSVPVLRPLGPRVLVRVLGGGAGGGGDGRKPAAAVAAAVPGSRNAGSSDASQMRVEAGAQQAEAGAGAQEAAAAAGGSGPGRPPAAAPAAYPLVNDVLACLPALKVPRAHAPSLTAFVARTAAAPFQQQVQLLQQAAEGGAGADKGTVSAAAASACSSSSSSLSAAMPAPPVALHVATPLVTPASRAQWTEFETWTLLAVLAEATGTNAYAYVRMRMHACKQTV